MQYLTQERSRHVRKADRVAKHRLRCIAAWSTLIVLSYGAWLLGLIIREGFAAIGLPMVVILFGVLTSFVFRLLAAFVCMWAFVTACDAQLQRIDDFELEHAGCGGSVLMGHGECVVPKQRIDARAAAAAYMQLTADMKRVSKSFTPFFFGILVAPATTITMLVAAVLENRSFAHTNWWFILYEVHYFVMAWMVLARAAALTARVHKLTRALQGALAMETAPEVGADEDVERGLLQYVHMSSSTNAFLQLLGSARGFSVLGSVVDYGLVMRILYLYALVTIYVVEITLGGNKL
eukprot:g1210.t1